MIYFDKIMALMPLGTLLVVLLVFLALTVEDGTGFDTNTHALPRSRVYTRNELLELRDIPAGYLPNGHE